MIGVSKIWPRIKRGFFIFKEGAMGKTTKKSGAKKGGGKGC